ncbi:MULTISPECIES: hypothetical protein [Paenibacillus]|uniref:Oxidoreductase molybdopterin-binding domain-containing protein n=1 Tax=Paenibacillus validus TaxID=44253 RepID=A0A7X2ZFA1_9BACL|nr:MULTISPECIES: hypothetical protein [Paenibacillus]MUG73250.1 hypothetical protein [Paenibacillus validus]
MIEVVDDSKGSVRYSSPGELAAVCSETIDPELRINGLKGQAVDWQAWYEAWSAAQGADVSLQPTHLQVAAVDEFQATIPWHELRDAFILYAQEEGQPLQKGFPIRLYVPNGSSECLNVKSVVRLCLLYDPALGDKATFGFSNTVTPEQMLANRQSK